MSLRAEIDPLWINMRKTASESDDYRRILITTSQSQIVHMCIQPIDGGIDAEVHDVDQTIEVLGGTVKIVFRRRIGNKEYMHRTVELTPGAFVFIPARTMHEVVNSTASPVHLWVTYTGAVHRPDLVWHRKNEPPILAITGEVYSVPPTGLNTISPMRVFQNRPPVSVTIPYPQGGLASPLDDTARIRMQLSRAPRSPATPSTPSSATYSTDVSPAYSRLLAEDNNDFLMMDDTPVSGQPTGNPSVRRYDNDDDGDDYLTDFLGEYFD